MECVFLGRRSTRGDAQETVPRLLAALALILTAACGPARADDPTLDRIEFRLQELSERVVEISALIRNRSDRRVRFELSLLPRRDDGEGCKTIGKPAHDESEFFSTQPVITSGEIEPRGWSHRSYYVSAMSFLGQCSVSYDLRFSGHPEWNIKGDWIAEFKERDRSDWGRLATAIVIENGPLEMERTLRILIRNSSAEPHLFWISARLIETEPGKPSNWRWGDEMFRNATLDDGVIEVPGHSWGVLVTRLHYWKVEGDEPFVDGTGWVELSSTGLKDSSDRMSARLAFSTQSNLEFRWRRFFEE